MERKSKRYTLDVLNAPPSTLSWIDAMMDEITESLEDVPDCDFVLTPSPLPLEASNDNEN